MKRCILCSLCAIVPILGLCQEPVTELQPMSTTTQRQVLPREVSLKIDALTDEQTQAGLTEEELKKTISEILLESDISINESLSQPMLILKIRTIKAGLDCATFFQLSLMEEVMLVRNRAMFSAPTWSQASLLACRPEELRTETIDAISEMTKTFSRDFVKAFQPIG